MSLINKMKMVVSISRLTNTITDDYGNYLPQWSVLYSDVKCFIYSLEFASGKLLLNRVGQDLENLYLGMFKSNQDIREGDKLVCSAFNNDFYVNSVNPITNGRTGKIHHIECTLRLERL